MLNDKVEELEIVAKELLDKEIIFQSDLERLIGKRPFAKETTYEAFTKKEKSNGVDDENIKDAKEKEVTDNAEEKEVTDNADGQEDTQTNERDGSSEPKAISSRKEDSK